MKLNRLLTVVFLLFASFCTTESFCQYGEEEVYRPQRAKLPTNSIMVAHDYTGDGLEDLIGCHQFTLYFYQSLGDGNFENIAGTGIPIPTGASNMPRGMSKADFNGDGVPEIVVFNRNRVFIYEYQNGQFSLINTIITEESNITDCIFFDFNSDGFLDLVQISNANRWFYLNDGQNGFSLAQTVSALLPTSPFQQPPAVTSGDLNGNGLEDVMVVASSGFELWQNNGDGTFVNASITPFLGTSNHQAFSGIVLDLDNDGWNDIVVSRASSVQPCNSYNPTNGKITYYRNAGDGTLYIEDEIQMNRPYKDIHAADVDGDGAIELVVTYAPDSWYDRSFESEIDPCNGVNRGVDMIRLMDGELILEPMASLGSTALNTPLVLMRKTILADITGNSLPDLIIPQSIQGSFITLPAAVMMNKDGFKTDPWNDFQLLGESRERIVRNMVKGNLEEAGEENLYLIETSSSSISLIKRIPSEENYRDSVIFNRLVNVGYDNAQYAELSLADLNGDGLDDVIIKYPSTFQAGDIQFDLFNVEMFINQGDGFVPFQTYTNFSGLFGLNRFIDVNGDGLLDFVNTRITIGSKLRIKVFYNNGDGFSAPLVQEIPGVRRGLVIEDVNGDGLPDLFYINQQNVLKVQLNSSGEFTGLSKALLQLESSFFNSLILPSSESSSTFQLVLFPVVSTSTNIPASLPTTLYTFSLDEQLLNTQELLPSSSAPQAVYFSDLYGTGKLDLVYFIREAGENKVYVKRALANESYGEPELLHTAPASNERFRLTSIFDINNDDKQDFVYQLRKPSTSAPEPPIYAVLYDSALSQCSGDAPTNLAYSYQDNGVLLTWDAPSDAEICQVRAGSSLEGPFRNTFRSGDEIEFDFLNGSYLIPGTTYGFRVRCACEGTYSPWSTIITDVYNPPGQSQANADFEFSLYPNPATSSVQVSIVAHVTDYNVKVFDLLGRLVYERFESGHSHQIPPGVLSHGVYLISVSESTGVQTKRLIIEK